MERKIFLSILIVTLVALAAAILLPGGRGIEQTPKLPWKSQVDDQGNLSVFGITLEQSTLNQARDSLQSQGKANLFLTPEQQYMVEVYFQRLYISGIKADLVLNIELTKEQAMHMFERGERISSMGDGTRKVELSSKDMEVLGTQRIAYITYIPSVDLEKPLISKRFGEPETKMAEKKGIIVHWLYPSRGIDIAVNPNGKEVIQFVNPRDFHRVTQPLEQLK